MPVHTSSVDIAGAVADLIAGLEAEPHGQVAPSVYETARLVSLSPWLGGHAERIAYLLQTQRADGGWGPPQGYALVPTLSATDALLATLRSTGPGAHRDHVAASLATAVARSLQALTTWLRADLLVPDTPGADLIVPSLVADINQHLALLEPMAVPCLDPWYGGRLALPTGMDDGRLVKVRQAVAAGVDLPGKLVHFLEVLGPAARATGFRPAGPGTVGASPAATAAWIGEPDSGSSTVLALTHLATVAGGGPVPCPLPITVFEAAWVVSGLARAGIPVEVPPRIVESMLAAMSPLGTPTGPGLPVDADTTAVALCALGHLGQPVDPGPLWAYETADGFCTWPGEDGWSVTTNAHVLDAFGQHVASRVNPEPRYKAAIDRLTVALRERQQPDGHWRDRWHASPYYATMCCALALHDFGRGPTAAEAVARAVDWVLSTQRADGSWGRWDGTAEETAYALQVVLATRPRADGVQAAARRGYAYLCGTAGRDPAPPLWYGKELYSPLAIVRAAVLAALHLVRQRRDITAATVTTTGPKPQQAASKPVIRDA
ncbi:prenyltransferase [Micromonospora sp. C95]|nr:prenyltransferase [Micromonospora sp. C95]